MNQDFGHAAGFASSTDLAHTFHADLHQRRLADAEAHRRRRQLPNQGHGRAGRRVLRSIASRLRHAPSHPDEKVLRLRRSWLAPDRADADWLGQVADVMNVPAGTVLVPGRFAYMGLDEHHAGLVVDGGSPPVKLTSSGSVLVLDRRSLPEVRRRLAALQHEAAGTRAS